MPDHQTDLEREVEEVHLKFPLSTLFLACKGVGFISRCGRRRCDGLRYISLGQGQDYVSLFDLVLAALG